MINNQTSIKVCESMHVMDDHISSILELTESVIEWILSISIEIEGRLLSLKSYRDRDMEQISLYL